jgi:hypothetical protein
MSQVARTIQSQIGNQALYMMGATNLGTSGNDLSFRIKGSKRVNHISIALNSMDTYDMVFRKIWGTKITLVVEHNGVYCDMMKGLIEKETGLFLSL